MVIGILVVIALAGFAVSISLGIMAAVFAAVWIAVFAYRREYRKRLAAGRLPGPAPD